MNHAALRRGSVPALAVLLWPALGYPQGGVAIDHSEIGCLVAEKFPAIEACFAPAADLARARVYFRTEGTESWYYVDSWGHRPPKAQSTCLQTTLPKPKKSMIAKRVEYYVEAVGKTMGESQTPHYSPTVVASESACAKNKKAAGVLPSSLGNVLPGIPPGFALAGGGSALGTVAAVVGAGALGGAIGAVAGGGGGSATPTTTPVVPTTAPPVATVPPTTGTVPSATGFNPVFKVFRGAALETGNLVSGGDPLPLRFLMCESTGPFRLRFGVFINGAQVTANCDSLVTFTASGFVATSLGPGRISGPVAADVSYAVRMSMQSDGPGNNPKADRNLVVNVITGGPTTTTTTTTTLPGCKPGDTQGPVVVLVTPKKPKRYPFPDFFPIPFTATADDATKGNSGVARVEYFFGVNQKTPPFTGTAAVGTSTIAAGNYPINWSQAAAEAFLGTVCEAAGEAYAVAFDNCGNSTRSAGEYAIVIALQTGTCPPTTLSRPGSPARLDAAAAADGSGREQVVVSQLQMAGARGQVVPNGTQALFPERGRVLLRARFLPGENRVEATVVQAEGKAGTWRFDLSTLAGLEPGSLRVIAGDVAQLAGDAVVFRLKGTAGERVVFAFRLP